MTEVAALEVSARAGRGWPVAAATVPAIGPATAFAADIGTAEAGTAAAAAVSGPGDSAALENEDDGGRGACSTADSCVTPPDGG